MTEVPQHEFSAEQERAMREANRSASKPGPDYAPPLALSPKGQADVRGAIEDIASRARPEIRAGGQ